MLKKNDAWVESLGQLVLLDHARLTVREWLCGSSSDWLVKGDFTFERCGVDVGVVWDGDGLCSGCTCVEGGREVVVGMLTLTCVLCGCAVGDNA